ncbi:hypothetical protein [Streptomyces sp. NPDC001851]|uniref:hypothetical protein n=1 Tax=Streptomyces sp. NPDC001851 TaxID=3154529 RepID=UPI0033314A8D
MEAVDGYIDRDVLAEEEVRPARQHPRPAGERLKERMDSVIGKNQCGESRPGRGSGCET